MDEYDKADMQSATIILGLMPTILSYVGPTVGEMALISSRRPVLAALLGLGAPAIFATRAFNFNNPSESLTKDVGTFVIRKQSPFRATLLAITQYLLLSLAVTNCLLNSMQLGSSTILSWKCSWSYLQLGWNFMPLTPHLCAALSVKYSKIYHRTSQERKPIETFSSFLIEWFRNEFKPSANHAKLDQNIGMPDRSLAVSLNCVAVMLGYAHWIFGTLLFSSALFIGTLDAFGVIARYIASALICRTILLIEIAGMRGAEDAQIVASDEQTSLGAERERK
ncbi:hypothetical protein N7G274_005818 [Stereocaulon virgatum]|uniref:Uncharacterized protein n=1 Tax=Stereocaulon virgatum TaxID=373712 RepID=A0ABR4A964_9LECA